MTSNDLDDENNGVVNSAADMSLLGKAQADHTGSPRLFEQDRKHG